ncbi:hypothetical protein F2Q69_00022994 [Brassica cretica]|uniref:Uncharacterized protein n=1 Tax=Brassica cretica TaxID=69181 RepID=A0A8S9Q9N9_BRACR|nr:hypothetical protein F2Q69_00022994 [Brassica cretica]
MNGLNGDSCGGRCPPCPDGWLARGWSIVELAVALPVSTKIFEKMVLTSSNVMTRASSWGISSLAILCSWKVIISTSCVISSKGAMPGSLVACREVSDRWSLERSTCLPKEML